MGTRPYRGLRRGGDESGCRIDCGVVEVDFFDEADGKLIIGEIDVFAGVEAWAAVLAHPPEGHGAEDGNRRISGGAGGEALHEVGPDDGLAVQNGGAVGQPLIDVLFSDGLESGNPSTKLNTQPLTQSALRIPLIQLRN